MVWCISEASLDFPNSVGGSPYGYVKLFHPGGVCTHHFSGGDMPTGKERICEKKARGKTQSQMLDEPFLISACEPTWKTFFESPALGDSHIVLDIMIWSMYELSLQFMLHISVSFSVVIMDSCRSELLWMTWEFSSQTAYIQVPNLFLKF